MSHLSDLERRLAAARADFLAALAELPAEAAERPLMEDWTARDLAEAVAASRHDEVARTTTVVGPHRDDLVLTLGGRSLKAFGSRGEARTAALALKVAEYRLLAERHGEPPVLLVDDFSAELDSARRAYLLDLVANTPQALVSGTEPPRRHDALFAVAGGEVRLEAALHV